eukprot:CAMPEP_0185800362 /NCGR_PEP_ID=MMETSP1322-20130828/842_1 /TAXON_ID=265543 /ORGANISM="Minutocellus polymorphus, Strain RCC2270" /LENGTH=725 /DNA_ID=CAMNT_0028496003 /DNA_START=470 /DNA_END=2647 /DNA_ORIENTATION=+
MSSNCHFVSVNGATPMLCEGGGNDAAASDHGQSAGGSATTRPTTATSSASRSAAAALRSMGELPRHPARLPSLGSLQSMSNPSFSSSGSINIYDGGVSLQSMAAGGGMTQPSTAAAPLKLQKASTSMEQRRSDMNFLRSRRRQWLEDQARQIATEEQGQQRLEGAKECRGSDFVQYPSKVAEAAAQTASKCFGSPLPTRSEMGSAGHFHHRSMSITGINLPSPNSQRFILNLPAEGDVGQFGDIICDPNATASTETQRLAQTREDDSNPNEEDHDDDDDSTVVMDCSDVDNNERFLAQGIGNASASEEQQPQRYGSINLWRWTDGGLPSDDLYPISQDDIGIPSARSSESLFDSMYRRSSDEGPVTGMDNLGDDFVVPSRSRSSEPRFATHFQRNGLRPKLASEASSTFKPAAPEAPTRSASRLPVPSLPPFYDQGDFLTSMKPKSSHDNSSCEQLMTSKRPLLLDSDLTSIAEKDTKLLSKVGSETQVEAMLGAITLDAEDGGVEVSLSADGFDSLKVHLKEEGSCNVRPVTTEAFPLRRPRPANVSSFDRSNSVAEEARGGSLSVSANMASANAFFTPPYTNKTKVKFGADVHGPKGEENALPSVRNIRLGGGTELRNSPPLNLPVGCPARPISLPKQPNTSSFGRSASVGGVYASPDQSGTGGGHLYRTPGEIEPQRKGSAGGNGGMTSYSTAVRGQQYSNQHLATFRPRLPSLASPMEEDE